MPHDRRCPGRGAGPDRALAEPRGLRLLSELTPEEVRHVALLARLGLEPGEEEFYARQLSGILGHIARLQELDTEAIPPTAQVVEVVNLMREDAPRPGLSQEAAIANAPRPKDGFFSVPAIQEQEP